MGHLVTPASVESLSSIGAFIMEAAAAAGLSKQAAYRLRLAVDEIATNSVHYGYAEANSPQPLELFSEMDEQSLKIVLQDRGIPYDPRERPPPADLHRPPEERNIGGLGIFLALEGVDEFQYERSGDVNRNIFIMRRTAPPQQSTSP